MRIRTSPILSYLLSCLFSGVGAASLFAASLLTASDAVADPRKTSTRNKKQVLCRDSSGKITVASSCKRGSSSLNTTQLTGPQGPQGSQGSAGRGVTDALAGGTTIRGAGGGMFTAPGALADPWIVVVPFAAVLPTPLTDDKVIVSQRNLRAFCNDPSNTVASVADKANDCLRTSQTLGGLLKNQRTKLNQFSVTADNICSGTPDAPTAPAGHLCIYLTDAKDFNLVYADTQPTIMGAEGFSLSWISQGQDNNGNTLKSRMNFVWAYTAPAS